MNLFKRMRRIICLLLLANGIGASYAQESNSFFKESNEFFEEYVIEGQVNYAEIINSPQKLSDLVTLIGNYPLQTASKPQQKAFQINAYNLLVIQSIINKYPVGSPLTIAGFFDNERHLVAGEMLTLNELEKKRLLSQFPDARLHLVLVCAAKGCPPLANYAYLPDQLETQLETQTSVVLNDENFIRSTTEGAAISKIFKWYKSDFAKEGTVRDFINQYLSSSKRPVQSLTYYSYDWSLNDSSNEVTTSTEAFKSNVQQFTPSALLRKGQIELNLFNNLYTQKEIRDAEGTTVSLGARQTFLTNIIQFTYGASESARVNVGWDVLVNHAWYGDPNSFSRSVIGATGPRIKLKPFENIPRLSFQSTFLFPVGDDLESPRFVAHDRYTWNNQIFFDQDLGPQFQIFFEVDFQYRIARNSLQDNFFRTPVTAILSYFPVPRGTLFLVAQHDPLFGTLRLDGQSDFGKVGYFTQVGLGAKYQITTQVNLEASYTNFIDSKRDGAGSTFNFGIRLIK